MLIFGCLVPHPPIILPDVGSPADRAKVKKTIAAMEKLGRELTKAKPDCLIISSPHPDWGFEVPWRFLSEKLKMKSEKPQQSIISNRAVLPILTTTDSPKDHFEKGKKIMAGLPQAKRVAWIASGDMSHRLKKDGPYGLHPSGKKFDEKFIELLKKKDIQGILNLPERLIEEAGECGLRSFCMLLGALEESKIKWEPEILAYEAPFGVGYLAVNIRIDPNKNNPNS